MKAMGERGAGGEDQEIMCQCPSGLSRGRALRHRQCFKGGLGQSAADMPLPQYYLVNFHEKITFVNGQHRC